MNNNKKAKRCIDCGGELLPKSYGSELVVCEECLRIETDLVINKYRK
jgi:hypothetical protein